MKKILVHVILLCLGFIHGCLCSSETFDSLWHSRDPFDEIQSKISSINEDNCAIKHVGDLKLPHDSVSHLPDIKEININPVFPNRTALLHLHNMALSRSFFFSYILQSRFNRPAINDTYDPGMMYYFLSTVADVSANPKINASAIYFSPNMSYTPSYRGFFNLTMPLFAPRTYRADDYNDPIHLERISTLDMFITKDLGAIPTGNDGLNYTSNFYRINDWYQAWLPDNAHILQLHDTKTVYDVRIRYANNTNATFSFHGPRGADENPGPVKWTRPYFDCGRSNEWNVQEEEVMTGQTDLGTQPSVKRKQPNASHFMVMAFDEVDISADVDHLIVFQMLLGDLTWEKYWNVQQNHSILAPLIVQKLDSFNVYRNNDTLESTLNAFHRPHGVPNIDEILKFIWSVNSENCNERSHEELHLKGDISWGAEVQFRNEALMAVRTANFISAFIQVVDPKEVFPGTRVVDKPLTEDQLIGEALAMTMGNTRIWSAGIYWDENQFPNRSYFAPYAYKTQLNTRKFFVEDLARLNKTEELYTNQPWFKVLKSRWSNYYDNLEKYWLKMFFRSKERGDDIYLRRYEHFPEYYRAANLEQGHWTAPYFDCGGLVPMWKITYAAPFFGWDSLRNRIEFKGSVAVSMDIRMLDIDQCPDKYHAPNHFKDTHKCDDKTSYCVPILGRGFETGGYKCECRQGFEYPFEDPITYYDGQLMEAEFLKMVQDRESKFDMLKCRLAHAFMKTPCFALVFLASVFTLLLIRSS
eukprot:maker-scaffold350_size199587-snap-gene-0.27 protein:Tk01165 transcript:maker-scaffold350_size199587-snap-gene-0.27-mRNA-1 annotation:"hypothetical protein SINV_01162"